MKTLLEILAYAILIIPTSLVIILAIRAAIRNAKYLKTKQFRMYDRN
jgi:hypothetical protein